MIYTFTFWGNSPVTPPPPKPHLSRPYIASIKYIWFQSIELSRITICLRIAAHVSPHFSEICPVALVPCSLHVFLKRFREDRSSQFSCLYKPNGKSWGFPETVRDSAEYQDSVEQRTRLWSKRFNLTHLYSLEFVQHHFDIDISIRGWDFLHIVLLVYFARSGKGLVVHR